MKYDDIKDDDSMLLKISMVVGKYIEDYPNANFRDISRATDLDEDLLTNMAKRVFLVTCHNLYKGKED